MSTRTVYNKRKKKTKNGVRILYVKKIESLNVMSMSQKVIEKKSLMIIVSCGNKSDLFKDWEINP